MRSQFTDFAGTTFWEAASTDSVPELRCGTRVVDENVEGGLARLECACELRHAVHRGKVGSERDALAVSRQLLSGPSANLEIASRDVDLRTLSDESLCDHPTEALGAAGYQRDA